MATKVRCLPDAGSSKVDIVGSGGGEPAAQLVELSSLQAAFSEARSAVDAVRTFPRPPSPAALQHFDYAQADMELANLRRAVPSVVMHTHNSHRQPRVARPPLSGPRRAAAQRAKPRSDEEVPEPAAPAAPALPADPVLTAHAESVHLMDHAAFRRAIAFDVAERARTAPLRPMPIILPQGPQQAAQPARHSMIADGREADGGSGQHRLGSSDAGLPAQHTSPDGAEASWPV